MMEKEGGWEALISIGPRCWRPLFSRSLPIFRTTDSMTGPRALPADGTLTLAPDRSTTVARWSSGCRPGRGMVCWLRAARVCVCARACAPVAKKGGTPKSAGENWGRRRKKKKTLAHTLFCVFPPPSHARAPGPHTRTHVTSHHMRAPTALSGGGPPTTSGRGAARHAAW